MGLLSNIVTVSLTIASSNTAPVTSDLVSSTNEDTPQSITLSGSDADGDTLTYIIDTPPTQGSYTLSVTGSMVYTPNANYN